MATTDSSSGISLLPVPSPALLSFYLLWLVAISVCPLIYVSDTIWSGMISVPALSHQVFVSQLLVIVLVWPLYLSFHTFPEPPETFDLQVESGTGLTVLRRGMSFLVHAVTLFLCSFPVMAVVLRFSGRSVSDVIPGQVLLASLVMGVGLIWLAAGSRNREWVRIFYLVLTSITFLPPTLYVVLKQTQGREPEWLLVSSPLTVLSVSSGGWFVSPWMLQALLFLVFAVLTAALFLFFRITRDERS